MTTWRAWSALLLSLCIGLAVQGCRCASSEVIAELTRAQGLVERAHAARPNHFESSALGAEFHMGDAAQTGPAATARLELDDGSSVELQENTLLRFSAVPRGSGERALDVETGSAVLEVGERPLNLHTAAGRAKIDSKSRLRIEKRPDGAAFMVSLGNAVFETRQGQRAIGAGDGIEISIGGAVLEPRTSESAQAQRAVAPERPVSIFVLGLGARARKGQGDAWRPLAPGAQQLEPGSSLELDGATTARIASERQKVSLRGNGAFTLAAPDAPFIQTSSGQVLVEEGAEPVAIAVPGGTIIVRPDSRAELSVDSKAGTRLRVAAGSAEVETSGGRERVGAGKGITLAPPAADSDRSEPADMLAAAGSSFVVHDPNPPTAIGFMLPASCAEDGVVERLHPIRPKVYASARGGEAPSLPFPAGASRYRVRCASGARVADEPSASGLVTIVRDSGTGALSKRPPMTRVDTDGRSYTVMYQNLLPEISVRWPGAPSAPSYALSVESRLGKRTLSSARPAHTFGSGELGEGNHDLRFSAGGASSPATKLAIRFENAAPTARISSPTNGGFEPGALVTVSGVAVRGWTVSAGGRELTLDDQSRFSEQLMAPTGQRALQIGFQHTARGLHYYLRRSAGAVR